MYMYGTRNIFPAHYPEQAEFCCKTLKNLLISLSFLESARVGGARKEGVKSNVRKARAYKFRTNPPSKSPIICLANNNTQLITVYHKSTWILYRHINHLIKKIKIKKKEIIYIYIYIHKENCNNLS